jgi:hypothetical protein
MRIIIKDDRGRGALTCFKARRLIEYGCEKGVQGSPS